MKELLVCTYYASPLVTIVTSKLNYFICMSKDGVRTFDDFIREGLIEYLDVNEENNALVCCDLVTFIFFNFVILYLKDRH